MSRCRPLIPLALLLVPLVLFAGSNPKRVTAVRTQQRPVIDGTLSESEWARALPANGFIQRDPEEGRPASEKTEIRVLYDEDALYFGCIFYDSRPDQIVARLTRRDDEIESDRGSIRIDCFHDHQTSYEFTFNAAGVKVDILQYDDAEREDDSWDPVWECETRITSLGWIAEVRIPFRVLRYRVEPDSTVEQEWGINFYRWILRRQENDRWAFTPKSENGDISRYGHLDGLRALPPPHSAEILPFAVARQTWQPATPERDAVADPSVDAGVDMKFGLANNFTLDATINPDFGQVEADPAVLNLTTFETFYPEKRPFFIEGTQILKFATYGEDEAGPGLFYSRRVGRAISTTEADVPAGGKIALLPEAVRILGAGKITGKTNAGLSVGVLDAVTAREVAVIQDSAGLRTDQELSPLTNYTLARLKQDVLDGSNVGLIATSVVRRGGLPALTGGIDWYLRLGERAYAFDGFLAGSSTTGGGRDIETGSAGRVRVAKVAAEHWLWSLSGDFTSPRYNINDMGYFRRPNDYGGFAALRYKEDLPSDLLYNYAVELDFHERWNFDGANISREAALHLESTLPTWWLLYGGIGADIGRYDDRETRGNGLYARPHQFVADLGIHSDERGAVFGEIDTEVKWDSRAARGSSVALELGLRPVSWSSLEIETRFVQLRNVEAWVENVSDPTTVASIFADRSTREFDITLRGTVTFTRELTLQVYAQQFIGKGHYERFRKLVGEAEFVSYPYDGNPDFNEQSFISNIVLRWEYLPGSTLFLVWSQSRGHDTGWYYSTLPQDLRSTFRTAPGNVLLMKISYWWPA